MHRTATTFASSLALLALLASGAGAGVPSAVNSTLPACMALCPFGDIPFSVTVRDVANAPQAGVTVVLDFSGCPNGAFICDPRPSDPYTTNLVTRQLSMVTNALGQVTFPAHVGGTGPAGCATVFASGVFLRNYALASPDQNGDGFTANLILPADDVLFAAKLGTADPTADFDCDGGLVDADDQVIYGQHGAQSCFSFIDPVKRSSWGSLKVHYR